MVVLIHEGFEPFIKICERINCPKSYVGLVIRDLSQLSVMLIVNEGGIEFMGIKLLGKGQNGFVFKCLVGNSYYACKVRRFDSSRPSLANEGYYLGLANSVGVGPRLINYTSNVIVMELIEGVTFDTYINYASPNDVRLIIKDLLWQCRRLDRIGLAHNELSRSREHIIVSGNKAYIIDFESASVNSKVSNVSQLLNALIMGKGYVQNRVRSIMNIGNNLDDLRYAIKEYKVRRDDESFIEILKLLGLQ